ncbi:MAG: Uncharacterised protein [Rhodobiaceae bacterium UBA7378]|nr:MAG: Uncharacterised protein [Rhodobiaceae bacterium UBA7378]
MMGRCVSLTILAVSPATFLPKLSLFKSAFSFILLFAALFIAAAPACVLASEAVSYAPISSDWQSGIPDSGVLAYEVYRDNKPIGFHHMQFARANNEVQVDIHIELDISFGFIPVFSYTHENREVWKDGVLQSLTSKTDNNGKPVFVSLALEGDRYEGAATELDDALILPIMSTSYFDPNFVRSTRLISSQDGRLLNVEVAYLGTENVPDISGTVEAHRFRLTGDFKIDIWYTENGRWVRTEFERGSVLSYRPVAPSQLPPRSKWRRVELDQ